MDSLVRSGPDRTKGNVQMGKFKTRAGKVQPDPNRVAQFTAGAESRSNTARNTGDTSTDTQLDPNAKPNTGLSLRLNPYQLNQIRTAAERQGTSIQRLLKGILLPEIERMLKNS